MIMEIVETSETHILIFSKRKDDISSLGDISTTIEKKQTDTGAIKTRTKSMQCFTCHENYSNVDIGRKIHCTATKDEYCTKRSMHFIWSLHKNVPCVLHFTRLDSRNEKYL